ncbi:MAG: peptidylprolyl isomerase [Pseudomonadota bacterium]
MPEPCPSLPHAPSLPRLLLHRAIGGVAIAAAAALWVGSAPVVAQEQSTPFAWVAKVGEEVITGYDVAQRARLLRLETGGGEPAQLRARAREELIDEELKWKEATRRGVNITKEQIAEAVVNIAKGNRSTEDAFIARLRKAGVDRSAFERRLRVNLAWNEYLRRGHLSKIRPSEGEVETEVEAAKNVKPGPPVYDVRQIVVDVGPTAPRRDVENAAREALRVKAQLKSCSQIRELAPKYSRISGPLGRLRAEQMPKPVRDVVLSLKPGETTQPLRSQNGFHIIMLCGVQRSGPQQLSEAAVRDRLTARKADIVSRSLVADLRRDAMIELAQ